MSLRGVIYRAVLVTLLALLAGGCASADQSSATVTPGVSATTAPGATQAPATETETPAPGATSAPEAPTEEDDPTPEEGVPTGTPETIGGERPAQLFVPSGYQPETPAPLLLLLHGYNSDAATITDYFNLSSMADQTGLIYAVPEGTRDREGGRFWNAQPVCCDFYGAGTDDSAYLRGLIEEIQARYRIDSRRIYIAGFSNGGFMAHRMACDHADLLAGIVSMAGMGLLDAAACEAAAPVAVLQIHGDADTGVRYEGGSINDVSYPSARQTVEDWARRNGCATTSREGPALDLATEGNLDRPGTAPLEDAETSVAIYDQGCRPGGHVELWTIGGADHIPGLTPEFGSQVVDFLLAHPRPE